MMAKIENHSTEEVMAEAERRRGSAVEAAKSKLETADEVTAPAREVEYEAAVLEAENPAISTEEATEKAKEKVGHPDPFNTVKGFAGPDVDITSGKPVEDTETARAEEESAKAAKATPKKES